VLGLISGDLKDLCLDIVTNLEALEILNWVALNHIKSTDNSTFVHISSRYLNKHHLIVLNASNNTLNDLSLHYLQLVSPLLSLLSLPSKLFLLLNHKHMGSLLMLNHFYAKFLPLWNAPESLSILRIPSLPVFPIDTVHLNNTDLTCSLKWHDAVRLLILNQLNDSLHLLSFLHHCVFCSALLFWRSA
jgi:hypothetical protein